MDNLSSAVAIIMGLTELVKIYGVSTKYIPLVAVMFGIVYGIVVTGSVDGVVNGIIAGLTSVGLYRTVQKTLA